MKSINFIRNKKVNKLINKILVAIHYDISYSYGGWMFFLGRLFWNALILYYTLGFVRAFFMFAFKANGVVSPDKMNTVGTIIWGIGIVYLVLRIGGWKIDLEEVKS